MKKVLFIALVVLVAMSFSFAQTYVPTTDVLGAHQNNGRGCAGCHTPHSGARGSGQATADTNSGDVALWGQDVSVLYGKTMQFGDKPPVWNPTGGYNETLPANMAGGINNAEVAGILMCLSCHDGNYTPTNMMAKQSYEQKVGLLPAAYGSTPIPTLLGADSSVKGDYNNDHPVGIAALIETGDGLTWDSTAGALSVTAGSNYEKFVNNYGWPSLAPGRWSKPYGVLADKSAAFVTCTTCHDQHLMNVYTSTPAAAGYGTQIAQDGGSKYYQTFFFVRGPYNVGADTSTLNNGKAASTTQFCRQCHFGESNEANNGNIATQF